MSEQSFELASKDKGNDLFKIDFKRVGYRALRYWYLVVVTLAIILTVTYIRNRYAERIYPVTASVIIREKEDSGGGELLYKNSLVNPYRNYLNEPYILRSYPMIQKVVEELNFDVAFYRQGNIKTTEAYNLPVKARLLKKNGSYGASLLFKALSENSFALKGATDKSKYEGEIFQFNDSIEYDRSIFFPASPLVPVSARPIFHSQGDSESIQ